ncbi:MAG: PatB family C-S lyase [Anaerolineales bacterium]|nr:PatB family C-S lyase [Anaerolineales bacterium]
MNYSLDRIIDRRNSDSAKWNSYDEDIIPLSGAELEFPPPKPVLDALRRRLEHPMFGYNREPPELRRVVTDRLESAFGWPVSPEALVFLPGVVSGVNLACRAFSQPGDSALVLVPTYAPLWRAPINAGVVLQEIQLVNTSTGRYAIDFDALEAAITGRTRLLILCNPSNPLGRVYEKEELERLADICISHDIIVCSDDIYSDWVFAGHRYVPIASINPEVAQRTITLMGTSKSHNLAGIKCGLAIIENQALRTKFAAARTGLVPVVNALAYVAALAAYKDGQPWQDAVREYIQENRDFVYEFVTSRIPGITMHKPEGVPVAWLDCRQAGIPGNPKDFFVKAGVALQDGANFGRGGEGFVRLAFGCPRFLLVKGLERMEKALKDLPVWD